MSNHAEIKGDTSALEFCGTVVAIDKGVEHIAGSDAVIVMAPNRSTTVEWVPVWAAFKLLPGEDPDDLCTIPINYATAHYALYNRGQFTRGRVGAGLYGRRRF